MSQKKLINTDQIFISSGITAGIMFLAFIMDLVVWSKAHRIDITPEDGSEPHGKQTAAETESKKSMVAPDTSV